MNNVDNKYCKRLTKNNNVNKCYIFLTIMCDEEKKNVIYSDI